MAFNVHPDASCILYDDEYCQGDEGIKEMLSGESLKEVQEIFDIESISIRKGCQLIVDTGI